jgi:site-specific DNA-methyltransferase (adenine-specific)
MDRIVKLPCELPVSRGECYVAHAAFDDLMRSIPDESVDAIYSDLPFGTGVVQRSPRDPNLYYLDSMSKKQWVNGIGVVFALHAHRILKPHGSCYVHLDWRMVWEMKVDVMDDFFGRDNFLGDIVWSYDWGARQKDRFSRKHDTILHYAKDATRHRFDPEKVDRVPYKAPELQMYRAKRLGKDDGAARIEAGKPVTDVFSDINIVGTSSHERSLNSYPTMKPVKLVRRLLAPVVTPGSVVLDPFCGSGTLAEAASELGCSFVAGDANPAAALITARRAKRLGVNFSVVEC